MFTACCKRSHCVIYNTVLNFISMSFWTAYIIVTLGLGIRLGLVLELELRLGFGFGTGNLNRIW